MGEQNGEHPSHPQFSLPEAKGSPNGLHVGWQQACPYFVAG